MHRNQVEEKVFNQENKRNLSKGLLISRKKNDRNLTIGGDMVTSEKRFS